MRKQFIACLLTISALYTSCVTCADMDAAGKILYKKDFDVRPFSELEIDGPMNIFIRQGDKETVTVETSERNMNDVFIENQDDVLVIDFDKNFGINKKINIYLTITKVEKIYLKGAGNIETKSPLELDTLTIENSRAGNHNLHLICKQLNIRTEGTGNVDLKGNSKYAWFEKTGVGNFNASGFKVDYLKVKSSGVGNTEVNAEKELYLNSSGVGNVSYSGNPQIKEYNVSGIGNVTKQ